MVVTINGKYFPTQHQLTGLCNGECECLLFSRILLCKHGWSVQYGGPCCTRFKWLSWTKYHKYLNTHHRYV